MIRICDNKREIEQLRRYSFLKNGTESIPVLVLNEALFSRARELFSAGHVLIEVRKSIAGGVLFYLKKYHDMIQGAESTNLHIDVNFDGCNLLKEKNLDTRLLERSSCFLFEKLEEYTYELTKFIRSRYPNVKIFYLDSYAELFWGKEAVTVLDSIYDISAHWQGRYMFIKSDIARHEHGIPEDMSLIYNSENVMNSLCWARRIENLGAENSDKTIFLIDSEFGVGCGLAYIIRTVCVLAYMAYERGWYPVVNLTGENMYIDAPQINMWEQYFEPLSHISVQETMRSQKVICARKNHIDAKSIYINPYFRKIWEQASKHPQIAFRRETMDGFLASMPQDIRDKKQSILGALVRGTDARKTVAMEAEINSMIWECKGIMEENGFEKIFLATEDKTYFEAFKSEFGNKLLYIEQKRVVSGSNRKLVGELLDIEQGARKTFGQTYLLATYCLAQCDALIYNVPSGGYYLAQKWRNHPYEFSYQIGNGDMELENIVNCLEMVENNKRVAIYGTGFMGGRIADIFRQDRREKIIFCDKRAESMEYSHLGYRVIPPSLLWTEYQEGNIGGIIIVSMTYEEEIYRSLVLNGVAPEHILIAKNQNGVF